MSYKRLKLISHFTLFASVLILVNAGLAFADDLDAIDDVESDMETALSESDAAQSEAKASRNREREEQLQLEKTKSEAFQATEVAKVKEIEASKEIKKIEGRIAALVVERKKFEKMKVAADKRIVAVTQKLTVKRIALTEAEARHAAAKEEKNQRDEALAKLLSEQKGIEDDIVQNKNNFASLTKDITGLKKKEKDLEMKLEVMRKNAFVEAQKVEKEKIAKKDMKRKVANIPTKIIVRTPRIACDVVDEASDGAKLLGKLKVGHKYEIYRVIDKRWVYLQYGRSRAYSARTCF